MFLIPKKIKMPGKLFAFILRRLSRTPRADAASVRLFLDSLCISN